MGDVHSIRVLSQLVAERQAQLRAAAFARGGNDGHRPLRRWLGSQLVRVGTWVAREPAITLAPAP